MVDVVRVASLKTCILSNSRVDQKGWKNIVLLGMVDNQLKELRDTSTFKADWLITQTMDEEPVRFLVAEVRGMLWLAFDIRPYQPNVFIGCFVGHV